MSYFNERPNPKTEVKVVETIVPYILISPNALNKMRVYVDTCPDEIGWLGTCERVDNQIYIDDVFLFDQEVHGATTEITPEGLSDFAMEIMQKPDGVEIWNSIKMWGHSHVNMGVTPSAQDNSQMLTFREGGHDWFIRIIANKKGELKVDLYDYEHGIIYLDLRWYESLTSEQSQLQEQIRQLQEQLEKNKAELFEGIKTPIQEEMKVKVRKKTYVTTNTSKYGYYKDGKWISYSGQEKKTTQSTTSTGTNSETNGTKNLGSGSEGISDIKDYFLDDDQVNDELTPADLHDIAKCKTLDEVDEAFYMIYGTCMHISQNDLERAYRVALKRYPYLIEG